MYSLVYRSVAVDSFTLPEIYSMLSNAKEYNAEHGITGCLLYHNAHFIQFLEGEEAEVSSLFQKISMDQRHHKLEIIKKSSTNERLFHEWSMAFHDYGQNGHSASLKMGQINTFINESKIYDQKNDLIIPFFSNVREILFSKQV